jgi:hypothetical protein
MAEAKMYFIRKDAVEVMWYGLSLGAEMQWYGVVILLSTMYWYDVLTSGWMK